MATLTNFFLYNGNNQVGVWNTALAAASGTFPHNINGFAEPINLNGFSMAINPGQDLTLTGDITGPGTVQFNRNMRLRGSHTNVDTIFLGGGATININSFDNLQCNTLNLQNSTRLVIEGLGRTRFTGNRITLSNDATISLRANFNDDENLTANTVEFDCEFHTDQTTSTLLIENINDLQRQACVAFYGTIGSGINTPRLTVGRGVSLNLLSNTDSDIKWRGDITVRGDIIARGVIDGDLRIETGGALLCGDSAGTRLIVNENLTLEEGANLYFSIADNGSDVDTVTVNNNFTYGAVLTPIIFNFADRILVGLNTNFVNVNGDVTIRNPDGSTFTLPRRPDNPRNSREDGSSFEPIDGVEGEPIRFDN